MWYLQYSVHSRCSIKAVLISAVFLLVPCAYCTVVWEIGCDSTLKKIYSPVLYSFDQIINEVFFRREEVEYWIKKRDKLKNKHQLWYKMKYACEGHKRARAII